ncbi:MAG: glycosyltransferase, partial [Chloroflexi bacterium]
MEYLLLLGLFWSIWLLAPILVDGLTALANLSGALAMRRRWRGHAQPLDYAPFVSIIVPVYNSAQTLEPCLRSIAAQDYPRSRMEVLLIDNGSTDRSFDVFSRLQGELGLRMAWHSIINQGKAWALNAGIHIAGGRYVFNVDSDVVLAPDAVRRIVERLEAAPELGAVTGAVEVLPPPPGASRLQRILAGCEFFEYLTAFHVGRQFQTVVDNLFTLAGAFSVFRREVLLRTFLYSQATVTEDTDLTFELHARFPNYQLGCVSEAVAYTHPTESLSALYAQRVRWQRGQMEVCARHMLLLKQPFWRLRGFSPARNLLVDHTTAFPRLA